MVVKKSVTIREVAQEAGVSIQTVSRVINNRPDVAPETRQLVQTIIERLGYQPNAIARSLIRRRSHTLGVVTTELDHYGPMRGLTGIEQEANNLGYSLILSLVHRREPDHGEYALNNLLAQQVDGIIWAVPEIGNNRAWLWDKLPQLPVPVVFVGISPRDEPSVVTPSRISGRLATEHLLAQGYQHIGLITGPLSWEAARQRQRGWQDILSKTSPNQTFEGDWSAASGEQGLRQLLVQYPEMDAVYASNDQMALGALNAAHQLGLRIPEDLGVVGTDNIPESAYFWPPLTTIRHQIARHSKIAVRQLNWMIENRQHNKDGVQPEEVYFEPELIIRKSSVPSQEG